MQSHPSWVRGLKPFVGGDLSLIALSHPSWVRGLKLWVFLLKSIVNPSHPSWVRGLKLMLNRRYMQVCCVAPLVGAWIETFNTFVKYSYRKSHPSWVRGLKHGGGYRRTRSE